MAGQIVNISNNEAISEVALKCGDIYFKDFPKNIYSQAVYRAERDIAKEYGILEREWSYTNTDGPDNTGVTYAHIVIVPLNFNGAWRVVKTADNVETEYERKQYDEVIENDSTSNNYYAIIYNANQYVLYYTNAAAKDVISIWYTSSIAGEVDYETFDQEGNTNAIPVLPNQYFEEVIRRSVRYIAQLGIAQFDDKKGKKYARILRMYTKRDDNNREYNLEKDRPWILIKPFIYP